MMRIVLFCFVVGGIFCYTDMRGYMEKPLSRNEMQGP